MADYPDDDLTVEQVRRHRAALLELGHRLPGTPLSDLAAGLAAAEFACPAGDAPMIIDTDVGGDADDALALAAVRHDPTLMLVVTADETGAPHEYGERARFARHLLDTLQRPDVPVVAGHSTGGTDYFCVADLVPTGVPEQPGGRDAVLGAVARVAAGTEGPIRWVGMAPLSNLALVCAELPEVAARLQVTQMGGAIHYRRPDRAEHNIRLDVGAAAQVLAAVADGRLSRPRFVISDTTFTDQIAVHAAHPIHHRLAAHPGVAWARLLVGHLQRWYTTHHDSTLQHDALTLSAALGLPFVRAAATRIRADEIGRWQVDTAGAALRVSTGADYEAFMTWLAATLDPTQDPAGAPGGRPAVTASAADAQRVASVAAATFRRPT